MTILLKDKCYLRFGSYLALLLPNLHLKYQNLKECPNFLMYTMEIQVLTEFQLKITIIGEATSENLILAKIGHIFRPSLAQILSKIANFERISKFSDLNNGDTSTGRV